MSNKNKHNKSIKQSSGSSSRETMAKRTKNTGSNDNNDDDFYSSSSSRDQNGTTTTEPQPLPSRQRYRGESMKSILWICVGVVFVIVFEYFSELAAISGSNNNNNKAKAGLTNVMYVSPTDKLSLELQEKQQTIEDLEAMNEVLFMQNQVVHFNQSLVDDIICSSMTSPTLQTPQQEKEKEQQKQRCQQIATLRDRAELIWKNNEGYLWMQHSRKAGGTTLCMTLRLNQFGLVKLPATLPQKKILQMHRQTCQIVKFCADCNVKKQKSRQPLAFRVTQAMKQASQNFIEIEGSGVPQNMIPVLSVPTNNNNNNNSNTLYTTTPDVRDKWRNFVFVSTIRDPVERIVSSLLNDRCRGNMTCFQRQKEIFEVDVVDKCANGIYHCHSNYFVRMFSGKDWTYTNDQDMLHLAQENFLRFSCVALVEQWEQTIGCLERLGMHLNNKHVAYNVAGKLKNVQVLPADEQSSSVVTKASDHLTPAEYVRILSRNKADMEFYAWAKKVILSGYFMPQ